MASRNAAFHNYAEEFSHIEDPNEQRRLILAAIDKAPLGWSQVRASVVAGIGFLTDSYDIFAISLISDMLGFVYFESNDRRMPEHNDTVIKVAGSLGVIVGQLVFGALADVVGRKRMYGLELIIIILATLGQSLASGSKAVSMTALTVFWRVIMGFGLGGDYPLSSVITTEFATTRWRGGMVAAVFAMQGFGQLLATLVALIATEAFKAQLDPAGNYCEPKANSNTCYSSNGGIEAVDRIWRIIIGFGAIPAAAALYFRLTIPETPRYTFDVLRDAQQAAADTFAWMDDEIGPLHSQGVVPLRRQDTDVSSGLDVPKSSVVDFLSYYGRWRNAKVLMGTAMSWFCLDVAFYGISLNNPIILRKIGFGTSVGRHSFYSVLHNNALGNLILVCAGAIPGYWVTVFTVDRIGRKPIQIGGFTILTVLFLILGFGFHKIGDDAKLALFVLCQFFFNFGPNATTFIVPGECFPTRYRSTSHGISAAAGKIGAVVAQTLIGPLRVRGAKSKKLWNVDSSSTPYDDSPWMNHVIQIFALFMFCGLLFSFLIPETKRKTLEDLADGNSDLSEDGEKSEDGRAASGSIRSGGSRNRTFAAPMFTGMRDLEMRTGGRDDGVGGGGLRPGERPGERPGAL